jgi:arylsulfatase A-like enzyme
MRFVFKCKCNSVLWSFLAVSGLAAIAVGPYGSVIAADLPSAPPERRPHVIVILADDAGWGDFSFIGNKSLHTPAIDSLARDGAVLEQFFVQPVCAPTRAELLTGRYHPRSGVRGVSRGQERLAPDEQTIADVFQAAGYATGLFGKWHNGTQWPYHPLARGFDHFYGFTEGHWGDYFDPPMQRNTEFVTGSGYITDDITSNAIAFLEPRLRDATIGPAFCLIAFNTPHSPMCVPDADFHRFADRDLAQRGPQPDQEDPAFTRAALAMVENLDHNVGRVLAAIDAADASRDTIIVFFSDNGPNNARWCGGMRGRKGSTDDGGVRSVCCLRFPGRITAGTQLSPITGAIDLLPTLTGLAGINHAPPQPLDGVNLSPLLDRQQAATSACESLKARLNDRHIISSFRGRVSVRTNRFRLDHEGRLYDMEADLGQTQDLAQQQPAAAKQLQAIADSFRDTVLNALPEPTAERFPVGAADAPLTELPARDGNGEGTVVRSGRAPNCSFFTGWTKTTDAIVWDVKVHQPGRYAAELWYTCPAADIGSTIELSFADRRMTALIGPAWDPPLNTGEDRVPRKGESYAKPFRPLPLGEIELPAGSGQLRLRAIDVPGKAVADVRRLVLRPVD